MGPLERRIVHHAKREPGTADRMRSAARALDLVPRSAKEQAWAAGERVFVRFDADNNAVVYRGLDEAHATRLDGVDPAARFKARLKVRKAALSARRK